MLLPQAGSVQHHGAAHHSEWHSVVLKTHISHTTWPLQANQLLRQVLIRMKNTGSEPWGRVTWLYERQCNIDFFLSPNTHSPLLNN